MSATLIIVDPGHSTGVAIFKDGLIADAFTTSVPHDRLGEALEANPGAEVVCEEPPANRRHQDAATAHPIAIVEAATKDQRLTYIRPSQWKGSPHSRLLDSELVQLDTRHEKDAASLGRWFITTQRMTSATSQEEETADPAQRGTDPA